MTTAPKYVVARSAARSMVAADVRMSLEQSREEGLSFPAAWSRATDNLARNDALPLLATREHWRRSYEGAPVLCGAMGVLASTRTSAGAERSGDL
jgi:hypothetical protein